MGMKEANRREEQQARAGRMAMPEDGPQGCRQARNRSGESREAEQRGIRTANDDLSVCDAEV
jgi:hypothetical protein